MEGWRFLVTVAVVVTLVPWAITMTRLILLNL